MANENHGSPAEEASLMSHSPGTSNQNQPSSPKPMRLVQDLPGTDSASEKAHHRVLKGPSGREGKVECGYWESSGTLLVAVCSDGNGTWMVELSRTGLIVISVFSDELVQAGWEKCWSKRENRPYYFNRFTNQSLWEMPVLGQHDVIVSKHISRGAVPVLGYSSGTWYCLHGRVFCICRTPFPIQRVSGIWWNTMKCSSFSCFA